MNLRTLTAAAALLVTLFVAPASAAPNSGVFSVLDSLQGTAVEQVMGTDVELAPRLAAAVEVEPADPAKVRVVGVLGALETAAADSDALRRVLARGPVGIATTGVAAR